MVLFEMSDQDLRGQWDFQLEFLTSRSWIELVETNTNKLLKNFSEYKKMSNTPNPFGNGNASIKIMQKILGLKIWFVQ